LRVPDRSAATSPVPSGRSCSDTGAHPAARIEVHEVDQTFERRGERDSAITDVRVHRRHPVRRLLRGLMLQRDGGQGTLRGPRCGSFVSGERQPGLVAAENSACFQSTTCVSHASPTHSDIASGERRPGEEPSEMNCVRCDHRPGREQTIEVGLRPSLRYAPKPCMTSLN
jgi:hypothetical protein